MKLAESDFIVLGFLMLHPMTGYELKAKMDATIRHFYRPSYGGIYPSLKKLARGEYVAAGQSVVGGKIRKTYRPLTAGKRAFRSWLKIPPDIARGPGPVLLKVFFLGLGERDDAQSLARDVIRNAQERKEWLKGMASEIRGVADAYQAATCRFGIDYYEFLAEWFTRWEKEK
jgi:PadR family transcriptional regulator AphA